MSDDKNKPSEGVILEGEVIPNTDKKYEQAKSALAVGDAEQAHALASNKETPPEVLYYLAENGDDEARVGVAKNTATPMQADEILVDDEHAEVRMELARKIARIIPNLNPDDADELQKHSINILNKLAEDQLPKVREIIATELKETDKAPKELIIKLAHDPEEIVAAPILEYSPLLSDNDLREIVAAGVVGEALEAISRRKKISDDLAEAIASTLEIPAVAALLTNKDADIREETMVKIVTQAQTTEVLHKPLVERPNLSLRIMKRVAGFVASALVHKMVDNAQLDEKTASELIRRTRKVIDGQAPDIEDTMSAQERAMDFLNRGMLDDDLVLDLIKNRKKQLLVHCLALMASLSVPVVDKILSSKNGRAVTALCWMAELKMRTAIEVQIKIAGVPHAQAVQAKGGTDYPFNQAEMQQNLLFFTG
ncbi:MAG: DUF2336 domain-containing protein [Sphingomonadales bacterium]|nr:DUF2336 domain-containing protein [Sphingomonadales bacterium]